MCRRLVEEAVVDTGDGKIEEGRSNLKFCLLSWSSGGEDSTMARWRGRVRIVFGVLTHRPRHPPSSNWRPSCMRRVFLGGRSQAIGDFLLQSIDPLCALRDVIMHRLIIGRARGG